MDFEEFSRDVEEPSNNTENRNFLDAAFMNFLLPTIKREVINELQIFMEVYPNLRSPGGYRTFLRDPVKPTTKFYYSEERFPNNDSLPGVSSFANLYFKIPQEFDIFKCGDVRKFLHIISFAGCFSSEQAYNASDLKKLYDKFAHNDVISYFDKIEAYRLVKNMLDSFSDTSQENENQKNSTTVANTVSYSSLVKKDKVVNKTCPVGVEQDKKVSDNHISKKLEFNRKYSPDIQVKFGPIPGKIEYREVYDTMKRFFGTIGEVQSQFLEPKPHQEGNNEVRYGLVVFKSKKDASIALNKEFVLLRRNKIKLFKN